MKNKYLQLLYIQTIYLFICITAVYANEQSIHPYANGDGHTSETIGNDFGYTRQPGISTSENNPVIGSNGTFNVSQTGAATYTYNIAVPQGIGGMHPSLSVVYNSQGSNGVVGWGCNTSGQSVITRGMKTVFHDGAAGGVTHTENDAVFAEYTYGDTGNDAQRLIKEKRGDLYTVYSYDAYGRVSSKTKHVGTEILTYNYIYNSLGQVTRIVYPGGVTADYTYDCYGNNTAIAVGGKTVWSVGHNTGKSFSANLGTTLIEDIQSDESGRTLSRTLKRNNKYDDNIFRTTYSYDNTTSNLVSKKVEADFIQAYPNDSLKIDTAIVVGPIKDFDGLGYKSVSLNRDSLLYPGQRPDWELELIFQGWTETYSYDSSDRLTRVNRNNKIFQNMEYDANGNILSKTM